MSKVLLINGSPNEHGCTYTALREVADTLEKHGIETEIMYLGRAAINDCMACMACRTTGRCVIKDGVNELADRLDTLDGIVIGSPVYVAGPTARLEAFLNRLIYSAKAPLAGKVGASVVSCRRGGATAAFDRLNKYFTISNMIVAGSQYWNQVHGHTPEDVRKDEEGLQTMRTLGENIAWMLECIGRGDAAGVKRPEYETPTPTHFIR